MSTRALFGNYKLRPPFPQLQSSPDTVADLEPGNLDPQSWDATAIHNCSVCDRAIGEGGLQQVWISLRMATGVLPLLVSACSSACVAALPVSARERLPARGGPRHGDVLSDRHGT
ncbi:hypothetical protein [Streptomyces sp. NPDC097610]|uniref:hypothetical protein n=1 Tax=Streptomyces sp. NPDC097610 TaxID=3157227 RepID=UPI00331FB0DC